jgi:hypothetical protein
MHSYKRNAGPNKLNHNFKPSVCQLRDLRRIKENGQSKKKKYLGFIFKKKKNYEIRDLLLFWRHRVKSQLFRQITYLKV